MGISDKINRKYENHNTPELFKTQLNSTLDNSSYTNILDKTIEYFLPSVSFIYFFLKKINNITWVSF